MNQLLHKPPIVRQASIFVSELRLAARVGVNPTEQGKHQTIVVDIEVGVTDLTLPAHSEKLQDTLDYVSIARTARMVVEKRHYPLVETLATTIAAAVLDRPGAQWVKVHLRKLNCLRHASAAGVDVFLTADDLDWSVRSMGPQQVNIDENIVIVGGGAAGFAAALWCHRLGYSPLLIDQTAELGGQLHLVHGVIPDMPGQDAINGAAFSRKLRRQFKDLPGRFLCAHLKELHVEAGTTTLKLTGNYDGAGVFTKTIQPRTVIITMGARRRQLNVPGEIEYFNKGILPTAAQSIEHLAGKHVAVIGGGDAACENAALLTKAGAHVVHIHRRDKLSARRQMTTLVEAQHSILRKFSSRVVRFCGTTDRLTAVEIEGPEGREQISVEAALIRIGWQPNNEALPPHWLDEQGYVRTDINGLIVGEKNIFAAGDILGRPVPSLATSFGCGATAAHSAIRFIENS